MTGGIIRYNFESRHYNDDSDKPHNKAGFIFSPNELKFEKQVNFSERYDICYKMAELLKIEISSNGKNTSELFDIYEFFHDTCYFDTVSFKFVCSLD
jgi:hypothetical protein